ncbi:MAG: chemotaxis protein CheW [Xanthobacteraceae bacterium]
MSIAAADPSRSGVGTALEVLTLSLDGHVFALEATHVREILDLVPVTEVPTGGPFVVGLINVRGKVVPLADLRRKFGMASVEPTIDTRIVVIEIDLDGDQTTIGLLADKVHEVTEIAAAAIEETPRVGMTWRQELIRCIGKRGDEFIVVIDIGGLFSSAGRAKPEFGADRAAA